jgi:hypothetical protein
VHLFHEMPAGRPTDFRPRCRNPKCLARPFAREVLVRQLSQNQSLQHNKFVTLSNNHSQAAPNVIRARFEFAALHFRHDFLSLLGMLRHNTIMSFGRKTLIRRPFDNVVILNIPKAALATKARFLPKLSRYEHRDVSGHPLALLLAGADGGCRIIFVLQYLTRRCGRIRTHCGLTVNFSDARTVACQSIT